jgi:hypothetical protein
MARCTYTNCKSSFDLYQVQQLDSVCMYSSIIIHTEDEKSEVFYMI